MYFAIVAAPRLRSSTPVGPGWSHSTDLHNNPLLSHHWARGRGHLALRGVVVASRVAIAMPTAITDEQCFKEVELPPARGEPTRGLQLRQLSFGTQAIAIATDGLGVDS